MGRDCLCVRSVDYVLSTVVFRRTHLGYAYTHAPICFFFLIVNTNIFNLLYSTWTLNSIFLRSDSGVFFMLFVYVSVLSHVKLTKIH